MVTGDHPNTAQTIARALGMAECMDQVITGSNLRKAENEGQGPWIALASKVKVFAREEPRRKLQIVTYLGPPGLYRCSHG